MLTQGVCGAVRGAQSQPLEEEEGGVRWSQPQPGDSSPVGAGRWLLRC